LEYLPRVRGRPRSSQPAERIDRGRPARNVRRRGDYGFIFGVGTGNGVGRGGCGLTGESLLGFWMLDC
jgi:hypothetical protein